MAWHTVDHHGDGRVELHVRMGRGENEALVATDAEAYFLPAYVARHGYVGVFLDRPDVDWDEIDELVVEAYRLVAPATCAGSWPTDQACAGGVAPTGGGSGFDGRPATKSRIQSVAGPNRAS